MVYLLESLPFWKVITQQQQHPQQYQQQQQQQWQYQRLKL